MKKLLVINSFGPMASTLLSGLMEKFDFTNVPIRKLGLHQYLLGKLDLNSGYMEERLKLNLKNHSTLGLRGGVSVIDRDNQAPTALVDYEKVKDQINNINANNIQELYFQCRKIYCDAVIYKEITSNQDWQIELTVDIHRYNHKDLYQAYQDNFDEVKMIHLHRPFSGWINSLASQAFVHPELKNRIKFFPHMRYNDYKLYEEAVAQMEGMHIDFDELFDTPIEKLSEEIAAFLNIAPPKCDLRQEEYDMYGKIVPYDKAFTRFDDKICFLQKKSLNYMDKVAKTEQITKFPHNIISWLYYLWSLHIYRRNNT